MAATIIRLSRTEFQAALPSLLAIFQAAMHYPAAVAASRRRQWLAHSRLTGWDCYAARDTAGHLTGFVYGYTGAKGQWWHSQVENRLTLRQALRRQEPGAVPSAPTAAATPGHSATVTPISPSQARLALDDYAELTELHVAPAQQGNGLGRRLAEAFISARTEPYVLLSTPEVPSPNRAWNLYYGLGFQDFLRTVSFPGDPRTFGILCLQLDGSPPGHRPSPPGGTAASGPTRPSFTGPRRG